MSPNAQEITVAPISTDSAKGYNDQAVSLSKQITTLVIKDQASYETAATLLKSIKDIGKMAEEARKKITTPLDAAKSAVMDLFRPTSTAVDNLEKHLKSLMIAYVNEEERKRKAEEEKLRKIAEAAEAKERKRLEEQAAKALANGKTDKAEELSQRAATVNRVAPIVASTVQKVSGVSMKQNWKARVIDINAVPRAYLIVDEKKLDQIAKATKGSLTLAGIEFYSEDVLASR